jgi:hypothetical protein
LDAKLITITEIGRQYEVSHASIYRWRKMHSLHYQKPTKIVIEMESEAIKSKQLQERNAYLEQVIGQKQLKIDYLEKLIEIASQELKPGLKKFMLVSKRLGNKNLQINLYFSEFTRNQNRQPISGQDRLSQIFTAIFFRSCGHSETQLSFIWAKTAFHPALCI